MIKVRNLNKSYGDHAAVKNLSFNVEKGTVYGFLGANGAGKTTTLSILTGCLAPDSGSVTVDGKDLFAHPDEVKRKIGYLPEVPPLYPDMTPLEYLSFVCEAKGIAKEQRDDQLRKVIHDLSLKKMLHRLIKNLSKGYKQRVGMAAALLGEPEILILDEPTVGLDPVQIIEIRDLLKEYGKNHTVILSSHILSEIDRICDRVLILSHGELVAEDRPEQLSRSFLGSTALELEVKGSKEAVLSVLKPFHNKITVEAARTEGKQVKLTLRYPSSEDRREEVFFAFAAARLPILSMQCCQASLEQIFLELNGESEKGDEEE